MPCFVRGNLEQTLNDGCGALLLVHPWDESWRSFDRLIAALPPSQVELAPDLRGHGGVEKTYKGYMLAEVAWDILALLNTLKIAVTTAQSQV